MLEMVSAIKKKRFIIILVSLCSYLKAEPSDTAGRFYFQFGVKRAWNYYFKQPESLVNCNLYTVIDLPSPGLHYGITYNKNNYFVGLRHSINQRSTIIDENPFSCERMQDSNLILEMDSLYGKINIHSVELMAGYTILKRRGIGFNIFGFYCPIALAGNSFTTARFYKDSTVNGFAQRKPGAVFGFGFNTDIKITKRLQCRLGIQFDRIKIETTDPKFKGSIDPAIPRENRYNFEGKLYGFNMNVIYRL
jgi:hypothetical protein